MQYSLKAVVLIVFETEDWNILSIATMFEDKGFASVKIMLN